MSKHTPGPWPLIKKMDGFTAVGAKTLIARVYSENFRDLENEEANARLIAAAPELLEAAKAAKKLLEPVLVEPGRTVFWSLVDAISKAEGRS